MEHVFLLYIILCSEVIIMFKKIAFLFFISVFLYNASFALPNYSTEEQKFIEYQTNNTINNAKLYRTAVYKTLDITTPQMIDIKKLDKAFYAQIKPVLMENYHTLNRLSKLTNQIKPSKKLVNVEKKKLKENAKILDGYKDDYEVELYKILTPAQKNKYIQLRNECIKEYKATYSH